MATMLCHHRIHGLCFESRPGLQPLWSSWDSRCGRRHFCWGTSSWLTRRCSGEHRCGGFHTAALHSRSRVGTAHLDECMRYCFSFFVVRYFFRSVVLNECMVYPCVYTGVRSSSSRCCACGGLCCNGVEQRLKQYSRLEVNWQVSIGIRSEHV